MSGFAGIAGPLSDQEREWLGAAARFMAFRGPDARMVWYDSQAGLAGASLTTSASQADRDPVQSLDNSLWIAGDVRLNARGEVTRRLGESSTAGLSDLEIVLIAYRRWGDSCLEYLSGDFAFAIWDQRQQRVFSARDQLGVSQFYYSRTGDYLLFGNTFECFFLHSGIAEDLNETAIGDFLVAGYNPEHDSTIFTQIRRLPPGHALIWSGGQVLIRRFWTLPKTTELLRLPQVTDYPEQFLDLLTTSVADRLTTGPQSIQLSGGLDSTSVAVIASELGSRAGGRQSRLRAFTLELDGVVDRGESDYARQVSESIGLEQEVFSSKSYLPRDPLAGELVTPAPVPYTPSRLQYDFADRTAAFGREVLTGHGGDVLLAFRPSYWIEWLTTGRWLRLGGAVAEHLRLFGRPPDPHLRAAWTSFRRRYLDRVPPWVDLEFVGRIHLQERIASRAVDTSGLVGSSFWSEVLGWCDPGFTHLQLRFRHPFFDTRLVEFVASLPPVPWMVQKRILREAMRGRLTERVRTRRKTPLDENQIGGPAAQRAHPGFIELLRTPALERFANVQSLAQVVQDTAVTAWSIERNLMNSLGLAYWLCHWRRPASRPSTLGDPPTARGI